MQFNHDGEPDQEGQRGIPFNIPSVAEHLSMTVISNALNVGWFIHMNAITHTLILLGDPEHQCEEVVIEDLLDEPNLDERLKDEDMKVLFAYEESMTLMLKGMRKLFAEHGYPELNIE